MGMMKTTLTSIATLMLGLNFYFLLTGSAPAFTGVLGVLFTVFVLVSVSNIEEWSDGGMFSVLTLVFAAVMLAIEVVVYFFIAPPLSILSMLLSIAAAVVLLSRISMVATVDDED